MFVIRNSQVNFTLEINEQDWFTATLVRDEFQFETDSKLELMFEFCRMLVEKNLLLKPIYHCIEKELNGQDIHLIDDRFLFIYYSLLLKLGLKPSTSALFKSNQKIYGLFGGQGPNEEYLQELQFMYESYPFLSKMFDIVEKLYNIREWFKDLPIEFGASVPVSLPLIGFTQLCQYLVSCNVLGYSIAEFRSKFKGTTGHSQGLVSSLVVSLSTDLDSFYENTEKALMLLHYIGKYAQESFPKLAIEPKIVQDCEEYGVPSAMLSINGLEESILNKQIEKTNKFLASPIGISLYNGQNKFVVTGHPKALYGLIQALRQIKAPNGLDQSKIPYSSRKPVFTMRFLPVSVPFHSEYLSGCTDKVMQHFPRQLFENKLAIPVYNTEDGSDLREYKGDLARLVCDLIFTRPIHWQKATDFDATHLIDFGPGGLIAPLTARNFEGRGVVGITLGKNYELYDKFSFKKLESWESYTPRLVESNGTVYIDTALTRLTGKPPIWCCGMTPSTVSGDFVAAVTNSGYSIELAGGGHYNPKMLREKVDYIKSKIQPGEGIILNSLYINQRQWGFQYPLWCQMRKEGLPIEGLTVAAGIPSLNVANEIIQNLVDAGIKYVSFKPGSVEGIRQVVSIGNANPTFPIILQWTGGRAGGHHSYEDFHAPLLATYASIRSAKNVVLVVGSGFGGSVDTFPYLSGEWSLKYGYALMPCDGVLFGSRLMVAKECKTSLAAKQAVVDATGVEDEKWEGTYTKETGGILTVKSELGEPIHKIATRGVKLWKEFDDKVFSLPKEKRVVWLNENKRYVIDRLNKDFQKPWFALKKDGTVPSDVAAMTYEEVALRMAQLMFVKHQKRWIHRSHRDLVGDFLIRIEERFSSNDSSSLILAKFHELDTEPFEFLEVFFEQYPQATIQPLTSEDSEFFLALCTRPGSKPVPFVGTIGADFEVWFKKDSLWQSEDLDAVVDQDVGRVCILQGPVAVRHSKVVDEPVKELLDNINLGLIEQFEKKNSQKQVVPSIGGVAPQAICSVEQRRSKATTTAVDGIKQLSFATLPETSFWLNYIAENAPTWLSTFVLSPFIVQGHNYIENPVRRLLKPREGQSISISATSLKTNDNVVCITFQDKCITLQLNEKTVPLLLKFSYKPEMGHAQIHEVMEGRNQRINDFYYKLWFGANLKVPTDLSIHDTYKSESVVEPNSVQEFCKVIRNLSDDYILRDNAPIDFAIVLGWKAIIQALFAKEIDADLLKLVHLSNSFNLLNSNDNLKIGDKISIAAKIASIRINETGKVVKVVGTLSKGTKDIMQVSSEFMFRGKYTDYDQCFDEVVEEPYLLTIKNKKDHDILMSKSWFVWLEELKPLLYDTDLIFRLSSRYEYSDSTTLSKLVCKGDVFIQTSAQGEVCVAKVDQTYTKVKGNAILDFLVRNGTQYSTIKSLPNEYSLTSDVVTLFETNASNKLYADISGDTNPIHVNQYFADYIDLPSTITHGMWTSAATRKYVDLVAAENQTSLVKKYSVTFVGMVNPGDVLRVQIKHIGMRKGAKVLKIETLNQNNDKVLIGTAEVLQPQTAFVFTGQGSQEQGMGMDLYATSEVARKVWDKADEHLQKTYSFSIIDIVKNNPKSKTIHFGGLLGQAIRDRYMAMTYDTVDSEGNINRMSLFPDITLSSMSYTFSSPTGLLFSTQFAQIALVVTEKAAFEDMKEKGLVPEGTSPFAGHSLGEYAALAAVNDFLTINSLCDIVFYRGLTMQRAVERDSQNRSNYAMCAVNPSRVHPTFTEEALKHIVLTISKRISGLCEIVNLNVENQQYVVAGELLALEALGNTLNYLKIQKFDLQKISEMLSMEELQEKLDAIVDECIVRARERQAKEGFLELQRGYATIPLPGIDIPFHSSHIWSGVGPFRTFISKKIDRNQINVDLLINKYIPNLTAKPFSLEKSYVQLIHDCTKSPELSKILQNWTDERWSPASARQELGYIILVELLAYQFASPVRWIETQDCLFKDFGVGRIVELGPSPTLTGMAVRTLKAKYETSDLAQAISRSIYCISKNAKEIYYLYEDQVEEVAQPAVESSHAVAPAAEEVAMKPVAAAPPSVVVEIPDEPVKAIDILTAIIAQKLKKSIKDVPLSKSIKDLVAGKSTLQNELLGDIQAEFTSAPEKGEEMPLEELGAALGVGHSGTLGKHSSSLVSRLINQKFPGGFPLSNAKSHLAKAWGLGAGRIETILIRSITVEPAARLSSDVEAKAWLDSQAASYAQDAGIQLQQGSASGGSSGGSAAVMNSEEFDKYKQSHDSFVEQHVELYMRYLGKNVRQGHNLLDKEKVRSEGLQSQLDLINKEHGDSYINGIKPVFSLLKARHFDSSWNWVRQDALQMWYDMIFNRLTVVDREITAKCIAIINRADENILNYIRYRINSVALQRGDSYKHAKDLALQLLENCEAAISCPPKCKDVTFPTAPCTIITEKGEIKYSEVNRENVRKLEAYVKEMAEGSKVGLKVDLGKIQNDVAKLYRMVRQQPQMSRDSKNAVKSLYDEVIKSLNAGKIANANATRRSSNTFIGPTVENPTVLSENSLPFLHLKRNLAGEWVYSQQLTSVYLDVLMEIATSGSSFENTNALLTGCGKGSIGVEVLKGLLSGGCRVVVTTSSYSRKSVEFFQEIFQIYGARGSKLVVVPFNQASKQDVEDLINYVYSPTGLNMDLDYVVPFAAISENGREIDTLDDKSELAHRLMLTNLIRMVGLVKTKKSQLGIHTRPTQVILPLSPNHGTFGGDGLYAESKIGLEPLFNKWKSESWGQYISLVGAVIGWTRGTGLMNATNIVAQGVEKYGVRTFSSKEMGFNLLGLMHPNLASISSVEPLWADLSGGMLLLPDLNDIMVELRKNLMQDAEIKAAIHQNTVLEKNTLYGKVPAEEKIQLRANNTYEFPALQSYEDLQAKMKLTNSEDFSLNGMIDLEKAVVIVGFAEVGPWGSSRTRWEIESKGQFSISGCVELARVMGYVKFFNGRLKDGKQYIGWIDIKTGLPITDSAIKLTYEKEILEHTGIRLIEPELFEGYDPKKKNYLHEVILDHDLEPFETSHEEALQFKLKHENNVDIWPCKEDDNSRWYTKLKKGASLTIPKAIPFDRLVAGQIPTGWDAKRFGIPQDIIDQVDPCTLWSLVSTAEALASAGITDPYELFKYVHVSEVGNALGSGMGGMRSLKGIFRDRFMGVDVQKDILQESFINTTAGWINLLLLSASGPVKIPVGACATALQSLEIGVDTISSGKAKVMVCGGFDDFSEEGSTEFANMKATSNSLTEFAQGRSPSEMSRPTTSSRAGFMEAQGAGVQILMQAKLAIEMGCPIYGVVALTNTAMDKEGRSVPAPGQGILSTAREFNQGLLSPRLDLSYRQRQLAYRRKQIGEWLAHEHQLVEDMAKTLPDKTMVDEFIRSRTEQLKREAERQEAEAMDTWGAGFYKNDTSIAPLRGALAGYGLGIDDVGIVSFHGTSTVANDKNESDVNNKQFAHLGRTKGNGCPVIAQKWLTGHPKGAAAAWMANGLVQSILSGLIPGNRNADNIAPELEKFDYIFYPSKSIQTDGIKAGLLKSFGFGQVGGEALIIHPEYILSSLDKHIYEDYKVKNTSRWQLSYRAMHDAMVYENLIKPKNAPPYTPELESKVLLNPLHRAALDKSGSYSFKDTKHEINQFTSKVIEQNAALSVKGIGIDTEMLNSLSLDNPNFVKRNYTEREIRDCQNKPDPKSSFTGKWCAKEAVVKAISSFASSVGSKIPTTQGAGAPLLDIEIINDEKGVPQVKLEGFAKTVCQQLNIRDVKVSISHSDTYAVAVAACEE
ncbi:3-oxoacyl-[acyl-carrier-protein] synthase [Boothiomyces macroporosus]|uniref:3-oxoacyl-[acyl-carrier-protein] synthase n=1 Tax=Boothiomyces macroporosus TaxID=261099 RepID=A0AAD5UHI7_9FUNG|nr:3-oxoacyl-[acyl-carrier-protein] synthase [Boothiomyces macroporosus]